MRECSGYRHYFRGSAAVVTIHNAGIGYHQEVSDLPFAQAITALPWRVVTDCCLEHSFDPFIAAGNYAAVTTVSENYARELQQTDNDYLTGWLGHRLLASGVDITGITNGIDPAEFNPQAAEEMAIPAGYDILAETDDLPGKEQCKKELLRSLSMLPGDDEDDRIGFLTNDATMPLYAFIGRLSEQKGVDILTEAIELFLAGGRAAQIVCLGSGGVREEAELSRIAELKDLSGRICFLQGFHAELANRIYAAADFIVIPSRYEPCGLTDYIAQLFGALPVVHHVGGLVKVLDGETGFAYRENSPENLVEALELSAKAYRQRGIIRRMQRRAVARIHRLYTWEKVMKSYIRLYKNSRARDIGPVQVPELNYQISRKTK
jgi:starch synthase